MAGVTMEYRLIDADEHYYEPDDCFSRHIESRFSGETITVRRGGDGLGRVFLRGKRTFMSVMPGDYASAPGALQGLFAGAWRTGSRTARWSAPGITRNSPARRRGWR